MSREILLQTTLKNPIKISGTGLHTGGQSSIQLKPAPAGAGIVFSSKEVLIPALTENVVDTKRSTTLGKNGVQIKTVEHLLSACRGLGVDNVSVDVEGADELPAFDGSSWPYVQALRQAGIIQISGQPKPVLEYQSKESFVFKSGLSSYKVLPGSKLTLGVSISFPKTPIGIQDYEYELSDSYAEEISKARTFCLESEVEALHQAGLAKGGNLSNTIVVGAQSFQCDEPLRYPNEFARHKILDLLGDLSLMGPGTYRFHALVFAPSHTNNWRFAQELRKRLTAPKEILEGLKTKI
ncbi:MAG: UDP-3-O-[3-hydroxymyristoyl] N-acetylglucosamine deacetylase [Elusimicrobia bacterium]|nr:UDP-3-O-[3-hydroxymyristoyl] N-acetylglucosamine deacetylase [Elusimicrobiota bacterium]